jgi:hypothetical protein
MPTNQIQNLIVDGLRALLATKNGALYLRLPLIEPDTTSFPDAWTPDEDGVFRLLRRIMAHAGLGDVPLSVERFFLAPDEDDEDGDRHVIGLFKGVTDGRCDFGINCAQLDDPEHLIGVLAHEVAHAFRALNDLVVEDHDEEEELTDLTTIFLGFGIFTTNNAHRETIHSNWHSIRRSGYLSADAMALALATWTGARDVEGDLGILERWLEPAQRAAVRAASSKLTRERVRKKLGIVSIPERFARPATMLDDAPPAPKEADPIDFAAKRSETFRVTVRHQRLGAILGTISGCVLGGLLVEGSTAVHAVIGGLVFGLVGYAVGRALSYDACARGECEVRIPKNAANCPRCGASVQGEISDRFKLNDALEELRKKRVAARKARRDSP